MFMDPELFTIEQRKQFDMWPDADLISRAMIPYIKRLGKNDIVLTLKNDLKGESIYDILESCPNVSKIYYSNEESQYQSVFDENTKTLTDKIKKVKGKKVDLVGVDKTACTWETLELYYDSVRPGGIFCGNGHELVSVKEQLSSFRKRNKIGTPILVSNRSVWFWYKR